MRRSNNLCTGCGNAEVVIHRNLTALCQFCWDVLSHELMIRQIAVRDGGVYHRDNRGPNFLAIFGTGNPPQTLGMGLYIARTAREAMAEARRIAIRNRWRLLRVDIQRTLTDIYVSEWYSKYFVASDKSPLEFYCKAE